MSDDGSDNDELLNSSRVEAGDSDNDNNDKISEVGSDNDAPIIGKRSRKQSEIVYKGEDLEEDDDDDESDGSFGGSDDDSDGSGNSDKNSDENNNSDDNDDNNTNLFENYSKKSKKPEKKKSKLEKTKKKKSASKTRFYEDAAAVADDDEEEEEDMNNGERAEEIIPEDVRYANERVAQRHEKNKAFQSASAHELAQQFEERHQQELLRKKILGSGSYMSGEIGVNGKRNPVLQQSLLPSIYSDPGIYRVKVETGKEQMLCRSILLKAIDSKLKGGPIRIKSVFCGTNRKYIYIEAIAEPFAREALVGLHGIFHHSVTKIPVQEMTSLLNITVQKKPLQKGQYVRMRRGPLKGDLVQVADLLEGGSKAMIKAIPRPDYSDEYSNRGDKTKTRPPQRLLNLESVGKGAGGNFERKYHAADKHGGRYGFFDFWNNEHYQDGFMWKEVNVDTFLNPDNVNPRLEELQLFRSHADKAKRDENNNSDEDDEDDDISVSSSRPTSVLQELAEQMSSFGDDYNKEATIQFIVGDLVQVTGGELRSLVAKVVGVDNISHTCKIVPYNNVLTTVMTVESSLLVKYIYHGAHVKVFNGQYMGQTGRVVSVNTVDGVHLAAILTDGINTEIMVNVAHLQMSNEVAAGHGNLGGYELYDCVSLNENEVAVVIQVGAAKLRILNHQDKSSDVLPLELQGKRNIHSLKNTAFDQQQSTIHVGDTVNVITGEHAKRSGTVKHIMKGNMWIHSTLYLKNSGVFVVKGRQCHVAGSKVQLTLGPASLSANNVNIGMNKSVANVTSLPSFQGGGKGSGGRGGKDPSIGKTVRIIKGMYKGLLGQVIDATNTHYALELLSRVRKINIERINTIMEGDKDGRINDTRNKVNNPSSLGYSNYITSTPAMISETPMHHGSETPMHHGSETPQDGSQTPRSTFDDNTWRVSSKDQQNHEEMLAKKAEEAQNLALLKESSMGPPLRNDRNYSDRSDRDRNTSSRDTDRSSDRRNDRDWDNNINAASPHGSLHSHDTWGNFSSSNTPSTQYSSINTPNMMSPWSNNTPSTISGTPMSLNGTPMNEYSTSVDISHRDYIEGMIVIINTGNLKGNLGVVKERPTNDMIKVCLYDSQGYLERDVVPIPHREITIATMKSIKAPKNKRVYFVKGVNINRFGTCKGVLENDIIVQFPDNSEKNLHKSNSVAWIHVE